MAPVFAAKKKTCEGELQLSLKQQVLKKYKPKKKKYDFAIIGGAGNMGWGLALNAARKGLRVVVIDISEEAMFERAQEIERLGGDIKKNIALSLDADEAIKALNKSKVLMALVKNDKSLEGVLNYYKTKIPEGAVFIDLGNNPYKSTEARQAQARYDGYHFFGVGISGGPYGAESGPSLMASGDEAVYKKTVEPLLTKLAASYEGGGSAKAAIPMLGYFGSGGEGQLVKTIHNGIEYAQLELIGEFYAFFKKLGKSNEEIADIFETWNNDKNINNYLLGISVEVLRAKTPGQKEQITQVLDYTGMKGTGTWTAQMSLAEGIPVPMIYAALTARANSTMQKLRASLTDTFEIANSNVGLALNKSETNTLVSDAKELYAFGINMTLLEGLILLVQKGINPDDALKIWQDGCILQGAFVKNFRNIVVELERVSVVDDQEPSSNISSQTLFDLSLEATADFRHRATMLAVPMPALNVAIDQYFALLGGRMDSAALVAALRDRFGQHGTPLIAGAEASLWPNLFRPSEEGQ